MADGYLEKKMDEYKRKSLQQSVRKPRIVTASSNMPDKAREFYEKIEAVAEKKGFSLPWACVEIRYTLGPPLAAVVDIPVSVHNFELIHNKLHRCQVDHASTDKEIVFTDGCSLKFRIFIE